MIPEPVTLIHPKTGKTITVSAACATSAGIWLDESLYLTDKEKQWLKQNLDPQPLRELMAELF